MLIIFDRITMKFQGFSPDKDFLILVVKTSSQSDGLGRVN